MDLQFSRFYELFGVLVVEWLYVRHESRCGQTGQSSIVKDLAVFAEEWLKFGTYYLKADIAPEPDGDNRVNMLDFAALANNWLAGVGD